MWRLDQPGEPTRSFDTEAQADAAEKRIRATKTRVDAVVWDDGVQDDQEMSA